MEELLTDYIAKVKEDPKIISVASKIAMSSGLSIISYISFMDGLLWAGSNPKVLAKSISNLNIPSKTCAKMITIGWHCEECCYDRNSCFCNECFDKKAHIGHNFVSLASKTGVCSCGRESAIRSEGFCQTHSEYRDDRKLLAYFIPLLPENIGKRAPEIITAIMEVIHNLLLQEGKYNKIQKVFEIVKELLLYLASLCSISPIFEYWVEKGLNQMFIEHTTAHRCKTKYYADSSFKAVEERSSKVEMSAVHPCRCSVLELLMRQYSLVIQNAELRHFLSSLMKHRENFSRRVLLSFCLNCITILYLIDSRSRIYFEESIEDFLNDQCVEFVVKDDKCQLIIFQMLSDYYEFCDTSEEYKALSNNFLKVILHFFQGTAGKILSSKQTFWTFFMQAMRSDKLAVIYYSLYINELVLYRTSVNFKLFLLLVSNLDFYNVELLGLILRELKTRIIESEYLIIKDQNETRSVTFEYERLWGHITSILITHHLTTNNNSIEQSKEALMNIMNLNEKEFELFIKLLLESTIKALSTVKNISRGYFDYDIKHLYHSDITLLTVCLLLVSDIFCLVKFIEKYFGSFPFIGEDANIEFLIGMLLGCLCNDLLFVENHYCAFYNVDSTALHDHTYYILAKEMIEQYFIQEEVYVEKKSLKTEYEITKEIELKVMKELFDKKDELLILKPEALKYINIQWNSRAISITKYETKLNLLKEIWHNDYSLKFSALKSLIPIFNTLCKKLIETDLTQKLFDLLYKNKELNEDTKVMIIMLIHRMIKLNNKCKEVPKELEAELNRMLNDHKLLNEIIKQVIYWIRGEEVVIENIELPFSCSLKHIKDTNLDLAIIRKEDILEIKEETICVYCKEEVNIKNYKVNPYGLLVSYSYTNLHDRQYSVIAKGYIEKYPNILSIKHNATELNSCGLYKTCGHYLHLQCIRYYLANNEKVAAFYANYGMIVCFVCGSYNKLILPEAFKEGITESELRQITKVLFAYREDPNVIKLLEALTIDIIHNIHMIDTIGLKDYLLLKHKSGKLLIRSVVLYFYYKQGEDLFSSVLLQIHQKLKNEVKDRIIEKDVLNLLMSYILSIHYINLFNSIKAKKIMNIIDDTYYSLIESLIVQVVWKEIAVNWPNNKVIEVERINREMQKIFRKIYCCLQLGEDSNLTYAGLLNAYNIHIPKEKILSIVNTIKDPINSEESKAKEMITLATSVKDKITIAENALLLTERTAIRFIKLESNFRSFYDHYSSIPCKNCSGKMMGTSVCLFCGTVVCTKDCCGTNEEHSHIIRCSGSEGIFIEVQSGLLRIVSEIGTVVADSLYMNVVGNTINEMIKESSDITKTDLETYVLNEERKKKWEDLFLRGFPIERMNEQLNLI